MKVPSGTKERIVFAGDHQLPLSSLRGTLSGADGDNPSVETLGYCQQSQSMRRAFATGNYGLILQGAIIAAIGISPLQSTHAAKRDVSKMITILALGDSLTAGYGLSRPEAYPALVAEKMRSANYKFEVINAGSSGDTTAGGLQRLSPLLRRKKIDILILALGINDAFRGVPVEEMRANFQAIIDQTRARHSGVTIIIAGMQLPLAASDGYVRAFGDLFGTLAEKNHTALIPYLLEGVGGDPELNQPDLVHPNAAGQRILAENVWRVLEPILGKKFGGGGRG